METHRGKREGGEVPCTPLGNHNGMLAVHKYADVVYPQRDKECDPLTSNVCMASAKKERGTSILTIGSAGGDAISVLVGRLKRGAVSRGPLVWFLMENKVRDELNRL